MAKVINKDTPVEHYKDSEDAYKRLSAKLFSYAGKHLINRDQNIDAVHEAFTYLIIWKERNPEKHISRRILYHLVLRACRRLNRLVGGVSLDDPALSDYFRTKGLC